MTYRPAAALACIAFSALGAAISATLAGAVERNPRPAPSANAASQWMAARPPASLAAPAVFNCGDSGTGSLRAAVASAVSGDTIDLTGLSCSRITLTTGAIAVGVDSLSIVGRGRTALAISGGDAPGSLPDGRVFSHVGTGTLALSGLTVSDGRTALSGGCISSLGSVNLQSAEVLDCQSTVSGDASLGGGAIFAAGNVSMRASDVYISSVYSHGEVRGGGIYVAGNLYARDSYVSTNYALSGIGRAFGGGVFVGGSADIERSSIFYNVSGQFGSGDDNLHGNVGGAVFLGPTRLVNSLVARNLANGVIGGLYASGPSLTLHNSTIAFNVATTSTGYNASELAAGVYLYYTPLDLQSTIIANNTFGNGMLFDLNGIGASVSGSHNLVMGSAIAPPDSLTVDPMLGTTDFSGDIIVMPLTAGSPAVDRGSNPDALGSDQRGAGFVRVFGSAADIGAFEVQPGFVDRIFADGFERVTPHAERLHPRVQVTFPRETGRGGSGAGDRGPS